MAKLECDDDGLSRLDLDGREARALALLSVAYWQPIPTEILGFLRRASVAVGKGDMVLANIHLTHSRLPRLDDAELAAERLFVADRLLAEGFSPIDLLKGLDIDTTPLQLLKASPDDLKHPGWPAGTADGLGGKFRPKDGGANALGVPGPLPVVDFSGGFHDAVVDSWMKYYQQLGIPAVKAPAIRYIGPSNSVIGYPDMLVVMPGLGLTVIEVKTGDDPPLTPRQMEYLPVLQLGGHIYSIDPQIRQVGLFPGAPFPPLHVFVVFAAKPGVPYEVHELPPPKFEH